MPRNDDEGDRIVLGPPPQHITQEIDESSKKHRPYKLKKLQLPFPPSSIEITLHILLSQVIITLPFM
jgi:hypothetical protein